MIIHFDRKLELCQQQNVAELIYFVYRAVSATEGSTPFVIEVLLNKKFYVLSNKTQIPLPSIRMENEVLYVEE